METALTINIDKLLMLICDAVPLPCVVVDLRTLRIRCGNEAMARLTQQTKAELAGTSQRALSTDESVWPDPTKEDIGADVESELEFQLKLPGGGRLWVMACSRRTDVGGEVVLVVVLIDVEERRQLEDSLADTAVELAITSGFPEMNPGPVYRLTNKGSVILANAPARQVFGEERVEGRSWLDLCPGMTGEFWRTVLESNKAVALEAQVGGKSFAFTHTYDREHDYVFVHGTDLTQQRVAEQAVRDSERMAAVGTLAAGIAHEMNNPAAAAQRSADQIGATARRLTATQMHLQQLDLTDGQRHRLADMDRQLQNLPRGPVTADATLLADMEVEIEEWLQDAGIEKAWEIAAELAESGLTPADLEELRDEFGGEIPPPLLPWIVETYLIYSLADEVRTSSNQVAGLVATLKAYTFLDQAPVQSVDVGKGLDIAVELMRSRIGPGVEIVREFEPGLPLIDAYGSEMNQVWSHLISNALDAMDGKGRLVLRAAKSGETVRVEVEDSGSGISEDIQRRVFDPFFTTKPPGRGLGLGLTTSRNIVVNMHRGTLEFDSQPGRTVFVAQLPRSLAVVAAPA